MVVDNTESEIVEVRYGIHTYRVRVSRRGCIFLYRIERSSRVSNWESVFKSLA